MKKAKINKIGKFILDEQGGIIEGWEFEGGTLNDLKRMVLWRVIKFCIKEMFTDGVSFGPRR